MAAHHLEGIARVAISAGDAERATRLLSAAEAVWAAHPAESGWWRKSPGEAGRHEKAVARAQTMLGEAEFNAAAEAGRTLPVNEAIAEARALAAELGSEARTSAVTAAGTAES
jgi:hypothetical protein